MAALGLALASSAGLVRAALLTAHSETVGVGGQMRVRNRMQVFANRRESNRAWLLHAFM